MADSKLTALTASGALAAGDLLYVVPAAGSDQRKATMTQVSTFIKASIDKGVATLAPGAVSLVVTAANCLTTSVLQVTVNSNDVSMNSAWAVPGNGSFTIYPNSPPTASTKVSWVILN